MNRATFWDGFAAGALSAMQEEVNEPFGLWPMPDQGGPPFVKLPVAAAPLTIIKE